VPEHDLDAERLGRAIQLRRVELGLKRPELAKRADLSYPYVSELENGLKTPSTKALRQLARAVELSPAELIALADRLKQSPQPEAAPSILVGRAPDPQSGPRVEMSRNPKPDESQALRDTSFERNIDLISAVVRAELAAWSRRSLDRCSPVEASR
jgi:transcriptional regulator with XRE-family HTH domain